jgi:hypothetical protein
MEMPTSSWRRPPGRGRDRNPFERLVGRLPRAVALGDAWSSYRGTKCIYRWPAFVPSPRPPGCGRNCRSTNTGCSYLALAAHRSQIRCTAAIHRRFRGLVVEGRYRMERVKGLPGDALRVQSPVLVGPLITAGRILLRLAGDLGRREARLQRLVITKLRLGSSIDHLM